MVRSTSGKLCAEVGGQGIKPVLGVGGRCVNQWRACPFNNVRNTRQKIASSMVYKLTWVVYTSRYSFGSVVPSYFSMVKFFQFKGRDTSMMSSIKGFLNCNNYLPKVLSDEGIVSYHTLKLVALGRQKVVDLASLPSSGGLTSGFRDLLYSCRCAFSPRRAMTSLTWWQCIFETWACCLLMTGDKTI